MSLEYSQPAVLAQYSSVPQLAGSENKTLLFIQTVLKSFNYLEHARVHLYISLCPPVLKVKLDKIYTRKFFFASECLLLLYKFSTSFTRLDRAGCILRVT